MDKRVWHENKKVFFYILVVFQTAVVLFTASYVYVLVGKTKIRDGSSSSNGYEQFYDLKKEIRGKKSERKAMQAFNVVVMAKGRLIENEDRKKVHLPSENVKRTQVSSSKYFNRRNYNINKKKKTKKNNGKRKNNNNNSNHNHSNYQSFIITPNSPNPSQRKPILMFVAIMSAPQRIYRRNALRRSWLRHCQHLNASCFIFTDGQNMNGNRLPEHIYVSLEQEQFLHQDLILAESPGGINFARRYLWIINWANKKYTFDFLLRVDDDYFICMDRLFLELPFRKTIKKLYWGHVHCYPPGGIRVDEGFLLVSNDLIQHFLKEENNSLLCHPFGDQAVAMWINDIQNVTYFGDPRVNNAVSANEPILERHLDICEDFLALHGTYPIQIEQYWQRILGMLGKTQSKRYLIPMITYPCGNQDRRYNKTNFQGMYYAEPIPCKDFPVWNTSSVYVGRSGKIGF